MSSMRPISWLWQWAQQLKALHWQSFVVAVVRKRQIIKYANAERGHHRTNIWEEAGFTSLFPRIDLGDPALTLTVLLILRLRSRPKRPRRSSSAPWRSCGQPRRPSLWPRRGCWRRTAASSTLPGRKCSTTLLRGYACGASPLENNRFPSPGGDWI